MCQVATTKRNRASHNRLVHLRMPQRRCVIGDCDILFGNCFAYEDHILENHKKVGSIACSSCKMNIPITHDETWFSDHFMNCAYKVLKVRVQKTSHVQYTGKRITESSFRKINDGVENEMSPIVMNKIVLSEGDPEVNCSHCNKSFKSLQALRVHELKAHNFNLTVCSICKENKGSTLQLQDHLVRSHRDILSVPCWLCYQDIKPCELVNHLNACIFFRLSDKLGKISCSICAKPFKRGNSFKAHLLEHINEASASFNLQCPQCKVGTRSEKHLEAHIDSPRCRAKCEENKKQIASRQPVPCTICGVKVRSSEMSIHMIRKHGEDPTKIMRACEHCGKTFSELGLTHHLRTIHHVNVDNTHECSICHAKVHGNYKWKHHLLQHAEDTGGQ